MQNNSRTKNALLNSFWGIFSSFITIVLNFVVRVVLVRELGSEINGFQSLFQSIISVMALMELGISSAMVIHLYEPIKNNDIPLTQSIMCFYRKTYRILAFIFFTVGLFVAFFVLEKMVTTTIDMNTVRVYFILFVSSISFGYLSYYKRSILFADQKNRVSVGVSAACEIIFRGLQILLIVVFQSYYLFLILLIFEKVSGNLICCWYVDKHYPYLKNLGDHPISVEKKNGIIATIKPLMLNQIAGTAQQSSKPILISLLLGNIKTVGYFGNYQLIISVFMLIYSQFGGAFTTSFGNLAVENNKQNMRRVYFKTAFLLNWIAVICCSGFLACSSNFIYLVFGEEYVLQPIHAMVLTLDLIIYLMNIPMISIQNAMGLHKYDAKWMLGQALFAIFLGYIGGYFWGMTGIFIGMTIPVFCLTLLRKGLIIGEKALEISRLEYLVFIVKQIAISLFSISLIYLLCSFLPSEYTILMLVVKFAVAMVLGLLLPYMFTFRTLVCQESVQFVLNIIHKKQNK